MKSFSTPEAKELYYQIKSQVGSFYDIEVIRDDTTYGMDRIKSLEIIPSLFQQNGPQIGGVNSTQCEVTLLEESENWPRMALFSVRIRISSADETLKSEWLGMGSFYTDGRHNDESGNLVIVAYDSMMLLEQSWTDKVQELPTEWPVTSRKAAEMICEATGIELENINVLDNTYAYIGLDTTSTARDVMKSIAVGNGGNWYITDNGKYRLNILTNKTVGSSAIVGVAIVGRAIVGVSTDDDWLFNVGMKVESLNISDRQPIVTGVEIRSQNGNVAFAGDRTGYVVNVSCEFADTSIAIACYQKIYGYIYKPFSASTARIDPVAEVGDYVVIKDETYPIISMSWDIAKHITADLQAPFEKEIDHEYTMIPESAKALQKAMVYTDNQVEEMKSFIRQTEESITLGVESAYVSNDELSSLINNYSTTEQINSIFYNKDETDAQIASLSSVIEQTDSSLTIAMNQIIQNNEKEFAAITNYIRYENGQVVVGKVGDPTSIRIANNQIGLHYNEDAVSYWNKDEQVTPGKLRIPVGGKFVLGSVLFQPRTSGNLSLMWVGGEQ